jgi:hypothetical protein
MSIRDLTNHVSVSAFLDVAAPGASDYAGIQIDVPITLLGVLVLFFGRIDNTATTMKYWVDTTDELALGAATKTSRLAGATVFGPVGLTPKADVFEGSTVTNPSGATEGRPRWVSAPAPAAQGNSVIPAEQRFFIPGGSFFHLHQQTLNTATLFDIRYVEIP